MGLTNQVERHILSVLSSVCSRIPSRCLDRWWATSADSFRCGGACLSGRAQTALKEALVLLFGSSDNATIRKTGPDCESNKGRGSPHTDVLMAETLPERACPAVFPPPGWGAIGVTGKATKTACKDIIYFISMTRLICWYASSIFW